MAKTKREPGQGRTLPPKDAPRPVRVLGEAAYVLDFIWRHPANRGNRTRKIAEATLFQLRGRLLHKPSIARVGERSKMWAHLHVSSSSKALYAPIPDWPEMRVWMRELKPGDLFVDVGANVGVYTLLAAERDAEVIAVEPDGPSIARLRENLALNGYEATVLRAAMASAPGSVRVTTHLDMGNHIVVDPSDASPSEEVPAVTLDDLIGDRIAAGVKIDVEGAESLVLAGAGGSLAEHRIRLMQIEWNFCSDALLGRARSEVAEVLRAYGYTFFRPDRDGNEVPLRDPEPGITDVFARPAD